MAAYRDTVCSRSEEQAPTDIKLFLQKKSSNPDADVYLELSRKCTMGYFCENRQQFLPVNIFWEKAPPQMFDWVLNTALGGLFIILRKTG